MTILVADRQTIEQGLPMRQPFVVISIRDSNARSVRMRSNRLCKATLRLAFDDAEPVPGFTPASPVVYMTEADAKAIWTFVREHAGHDDAVVVHCEQGISRSPAVAAALAKGLGHDSRRFWRDYQPNQFVYELVLAAATSTPAQS